MRGRHHLFHGKLRRPEVDGYRAPRLSSGDQGSIVAAVYDRRRAYAHVPAGGHRPPLQMTYSQRGSGLIRKRFRNGNTFSSGITTGSL